jgi:hypothetical protein
MEYRMPSPFLLSAGLIVYSFGAWAQTSLVHVTACRVKATECTISATGSGHLIVVGWQIGGQSGESTTISSTTDNVGNIYTKASAGGPVELPNGSVVDIWYTTNGLPGATSLVITANSGVAKGNAMVWEFSGVDHTASPDQFKTTDWAGLIASAYSEEGTQTGIRAGKTVSSKAAALAIGPVNACDINQDGRVDVLDGQSAVNASCTAGICNGGLASQVINASLGGPCTRSVLLSWTLNTAASVAGYNIYRGASPGGPYTKVNFVLVSGASYTDATVEAGKTYYYVATTVDTSRAESGYSNTAFAVVPAQ